MSENTPQATQSPVSAETTENKAGNPSEGNKVDQSKSSTTPVSQTSKSLYVADLAPEVTESALLEVFSKIGPASIASIRVCRDSQGRSLGYAYVNFNRPEECEHALDVLNFESILGKPCRISKSIRDPSIRKSGVGNLFVKNLAKDIDHAGLYDVFSSFGEIISCKVALDASGESKGYGFVHFASPEHAELAIEKLNGKCLNDKQVYVGKFIPRNKRAPNAGSSENRFTNIYLKHLNPNLTQETFLENLTKATSEFGNITSAKLATSIASVEKDGQIVKEEVSQGFGFSNFENHEAAAKALERFKDQEKMKELAPGLLADGQPLYSNIAMTKEERRKQMKPQNRNLYVKNIAETVTDEQFKELFEFGSEGKENPEKRIGAITSACIMKDDATGAHKGFGFVCYETKESAARAMQELNGYNLEGKPLYVALAQPAEERKKQLAVQFSRTPMGAPMGMYPPFSYPVGVPRGYPQRGVPNPGFPTRRMHPQGHFPNPGQPRAPVPTAVSNRVPYPMAAPPPHQDFVMEFFKVFPEPEVTARLGEMLTSLFLEDLGNDHFTAKRAAGHVLSSHQGKSMAQTVDYVVHLHNNPSLRATIIQQLQPKNIRQ